MTPVCSKCKYLTDQSVRFRKCARIPIFHPDMLCCNENNMVKDNVTGERYTPYCEEVNRHAECLEYYPSGLEKPVITFDEQNEIVSIYGTKPFVVTTDETEPNSKMEVQGIYDDITETYGLDISITHTCTVKAACIEDEVLSEVEELLCELPDIPVIEFDNETNTVTITSYNKVFFTTDGNDVDEFSPEYEGPFVIDHNLTVKAKSYARDELSQQVELECISIEPPVIDFDQTTSTVTITSEDKVLYSIDGTDIYDDSDEYTGPFVLDKNTVVKAACIVGSKLSEQVELECKVASEPVISYNSSTKTVTITGENTILYTTDGSDVRKKDTEYTAPFKITQTTTVKARTFVNDVLSSQASLECVV
jgi:hypothetical protein